MRKSPTALWPISHGPYPEKRPQHVKGQQAHPAGSMDGVLVGMVAVTRDFIGDVVDRDNPVENRDEHHDQETESKVIEEHGVVVLASFGQGPPACSAPHRKWTTTRHRAPYRKSQANPKKHPRP